MKHDEKEVVEIDGKPAVVLLVEDEEAYAELACEALEAGDNKYGVTVAKSLDEARAILADANVDLAVVNWSLPDGKGSELLPGDLDSAMFPIIIMTAYGDEALAVESMKLGALDYIVKSPEMLCGLRHTVERSLREWKHIMERKQVEAELAISGEHFRLFLLSTSDCFWNWDMVAETVKRSSGFDRVFGYRLQEIDSGIDWWIDRLHPEDRDRVLKTFEEAVAGTQNSCEYRYKFRRRDDSYAIIEDHLCLIRNEMGIAIRSLGAMRDITHELELEKQLLQAQKLESLGTLAGGIAHDFNNILQAILGFGKIASENLNGDGTILAQCLGEIELGGRRAADLVNQILTFSRKTESEFTPLHLRSVIEETLRFIRSAIPATIRIDSRLNPDCARVMADATQIHQVVTNLCTNALHAMEDGGGILTVSFEPAILDSSIKTLTGHLKPGEYIQLAVTDTGTGIDLTLIDQILDPFFTTKGVGKGTGLGLSVVHGIIKGMSGGLFIESELGKGTTVRMLLPVCRESEARELPEKIPQSDLKGGGHVMIVDDEESIRKLLTHTLESRGFTVEAFNSADSAMEAAKDSSRKYDIALLDFTMPGKTGLELAKEFESLIPDMPIILATGLLDNSKLEQNRSQNVAEVIKKPFDVDVLISAISRTH